VFGYNFIHKISGGCPTCCFAGLGFFTVAIAVTGHLPALELTLGNFRARRSWPVRGGRRVPTVLGDLRQRLLALPAQGRRRAGVILVDLYRAGIGGAWMMLIGTVAAALNVGSDWPSGAAGCDVLSRVRSALLILSLLGMISIVGRTSTDLR